MTKEYFCLFRLILYKTFLLKVEIPFPNRILFIWEDDLTKRNHQNCLNLIELGKSGLSEITCPLKACKQS